MGGTFFSIFLTTLPPLPPGREPSGIFSGGLLRGDAFHQKDKLIPARGCGWRTRIRHLQGVQCATADCPAQAVHSLSQVHGIAAHRKAVVFIQIEHALFERKVPTKNRMEKHASFRMVTEVMPLLLISLIGLISPIALLPLPHCPPTKHPRSENYSGSRCGDIP